MLLGACVCYWEFSPFLFVWKRCHFIFILEWHFHWIYNSVLVGCLSFYFKDVIWLTSVLHSFWESYWHSYLFVYLCLFLSWLLLRFFFFITGFQKIYYDVSWYGFLCVYPSWDVLSFLYLCIYSFYQIWKKFSHHFFKCLLYLFLLF